MSDLLPVLNGYVRVVKFLPSGLKPDGKTIDPDAPETNLIQEIFEGYFENGGVSKTAKYGRWFKGDACYLGFFSYDETSNTDYRFLGKGLQYKSDGELVSDSEGIYNTKSLDTPVTQKQILDFRTNELP